ncbi:MAG TPA: DUF1326 domain-containing protein [Dehalococcoidia bacterium]|nr:DUF1326 domain-containing protein [Dehalococcoidia bacterium]
MATSTQNSWQMKGIVTQACNCDYGCPCNFNAPPTEGHCEGEWTWHIQEGNYGDVQLAGLNFSVLADWPKAIHEGNGEAVVLIDERADERQRQAITALVTGQAGGPWAIVGNTLSKVHGPLFVAYEVKLDGANSVIRAGDMLELEMEPIRNPVTGAEAYPRVVLPQGFVYQESTRTSSKLFRVKGAINYQYQGKDAAFSPFEYKGP